MKENAPKLGQLITGDAFRDVIHIAVTPIIAAHNMAPGSHVGLDADGKATKNPGDFIGVIDPFLKGTVKKGKTVYLFMYPNTITGLRHEWTHPAFETKPAAPAMHPSEFWLRNFADEVGADYDEMMYVASTHCGSNRYGD